METNRATPHFTSPCESAGFMGSNVLIFYHLRYARLLNLGKEWFPHSLVVLVVSKICVGGFMLLCILAGTKLRTKAETGMNELSSRSHSVFCIYMSQTHVCTLAPLHWSFAVL